jgi:hypothetical protein
MYLDEQTKSFLLRVLNEQTPPGSGGSTGPGAPFGGANRKPQLGPDWSGSGQLLTPGEQAANVKQNPMFSSVKPMSDKKYYDAALKGGLKAQGYDLEKEKSSNQPSLEYLGALGTLKRTMGYNTDPGAGVEMLGIPFVGGVDPNTGKSKGADWAKLGRYATSKVAKTGIAAAALNTNMGQLGSAISGKLGRLALLGADPFDYATKVMGVDYVSDQISKLGKRQYQQIASGAGSIRL